MAKAKLLFQSEEDVFGRFQKTGEYIHYGGKLSVYDRKTKPVILELKCLYNDFVLAEIMDSEIVFSGDSISQVYAKLSKWYLKYDITFQN